VTYPKLGSLDTENFFRSYLFMLFKDCTIPRSLISPESHPHANLNALESFVSRFIIEILGLLLVHLFVFDQLLSV